MVATGRFLPEISSITGMGGEPGAMLVEVKMKLIKPVLVGG
jgi:hypothetical protein